MAAELLAQGPAVALLQGWVRGRNYRKEMAMAKAREKRHQDLAAARVQASYRGNLQRSGRGRAPPAKRGAADSLASLAINLECKDGTLRMPLRVGGVGETANVGASMNLVVDCFDGSITVPLLAGVEGAPRFLAALANARRPARCRVRPFLLADAPLSSLLRGSAGGAAAADERVMSCCLKVQEPGKPVDFLVVDLCY